jgi:hypothetical protein
MEARNQGNENRRIWFVAAAGAILVIGFLYTFIEWTEETIDLGYQADARRNPMLAAEQYLETAGYDVESVHGLDLLDNLPSTTDLIVMSASRHALGRRRLQALQAWVHDGGYLVVMANDPVDADTHANPDALLEGFDMYVGDCSEPSMEDTTDAGEDAEAGAEISDEVDAAEDNGEIDSEALAVLGDFLAESLSGELESCWDVEGDTSTITLDGGGFALAEIPRCPRLYNMNEYVEEDALPTGYTYYEHNFGSGSFAASVTLDFLTNNRIHCADHAFLLEVLAQNRDKVWLLADPAVPGIAAIVIAAAPLTVASVGLWVLLWAASRSLVVGMGEAKPEPVRRELFEHLEASIQFLWRMGLAQQALAPLRRDVLRRARRVNTRIENATPENQSLILSEMTGLHPQRIHHAMVSDPADRRGHLIEILESLQHIRRQL